MNYRFIDVPQRPDDTHEVVRKTKQLNVEIKSGEALDQHEVLNLGLGLLKDYDWVFVSDSDELISRKDQEKILSEMKGWVVGGICNIIDYAGDFHHRYPLRTHRPTVIIKPRIRFHIVRCYLGETKVFPDIYIHHLGYTFPKDDMKWKLGWEKKWEEDTIDTLLHQPPEEYEMPQEIREML